MRERDNNKELEKYLVIVTDCGLLTLQLITCSSTSWLLQTTLIISHTLSLSLTHADTHTYTHTVLSAILIVRWPVDEPVMTNIDRTGR